jgi:hypothetical protein
MPDIEDAWATARQQEREARDRALETEREQAERLARALSGDDASSQDARP